MIHNFVLLLVYNFVLLLVFICNITRRDNCIIFGGCLRCGLAWSLFCLFRFLKEIIIFVRNLLEG